MNKATENFPWSLIECLLEENLRLREHILHLETRVLGEATTPPAEPLAEPPTPPQRRQPTTGAELVLRHRIREAMKAAGESAATLAKALQVGRPMVSEVLNGKKQLPPAWIKPLCLLLEVEQTELLTNLDWKPRRPGGQPGQGRPGTRADRRADIALGARLRALLKQRKRRQIDLAAHLKVRPPSISRVVCGQAQMPPA